MSIVVLRLGENFAALAGDGVWTDPQTGDVGGYVSKLHLAPEYGTMFGVTGAGRFGQLMIMNKHPRVQVFDDFVDDLPRLVKKTHLEMLENGWAIGGETMSNVMAVGWSDKSEAYAGLRMTTYDKQSTTSTTGEQVTLSAFEPHFVPSGGQVASTAIDDEILERFGIFDPKIEEQDGPINHMVRVVSGARASTKVSPTDIGIGNIGGYVQLALLQMPEMTTSIVHRWPEDIIGRPVDPALGEPLPPQLRFTDEAS